MKVDNVTFVEVAVKGMTKEEFINAHIKVVWTGWGVITAQPVIFLLYGRF